MNVDAEAILDAISRALSGDGISDFEESFPLVRIANDLRLERDRLVAENTAARAKLAQMTNLLEFAWGIIANAGGGDWLLQTEEWQRAAEQFRDEYHQTALDPDTARAGRLWTALWAEHEAVGNHKHGCFELGAAHVAVETERKKT